MRLAALPLICFAVGVVPGIQPERDPAAVQGAMRLTLRIPAVARQGEPVPIELHLANETGSAVNVVLQGRPAAFDVVVSGNRGVVWRRLEGEVITSILQLRLLPAGDTLVFQTTWDQRTSAGARVPPGEYLVRGEIPSDPPTVFRSAAAPLRIQR